MRVLVFSSTDFGETCIRKTILETEGVELCGVLTTSRHIRISNPEAGVDITNHGTFSHFTSAALLADTLPAIHRGKVAPRTQKGVPEFVCGNGSVLEIHSASLNDGEIMNGNVLISTLRQISIERGVE